MPSESYKYGRNSEEKLIPGEGKRLGWGVGPEEQ